jgi:hypothetical protein
MAWWMYNVAFASKSGLADFYRLGSPVQLQDTAAIEGYI